MWCNRRPARLVATMALAAILTGCSPAAAPGGAEPAEPPVGAVPTILSSTGLRLPVEDYLPTTEQSDRLARARLSLIHLCMSRFGFEYSVKPVPSGDYGPVNLTDRRYGITDAGLARIFGYGLGPRDPARAVRPERPEIGADGQNVLSGQGRTVVNGAPVPEGGCIGEADRRLTDPIPSSVAIRHGSQLQFESFAQSREDSRVQNAFSAWSACMAEAGYHYADPLATAADPSFAETVNGQQIAVALADIDCKASTNLVGIWYTIESAYQRRAIDADPSTYAAAKQGIAARDRLAATVLSQPSARAQP